MLKILKTAADFDLDSVVAPAEKYLVSFSSSVYLKENYYPPYGADRECYQIYISLPERVRMEVAERRLLHIEQDKFLELQ